MSAPPDRDPAAGPDGPDGVRLQKVLASAGVGSRRACEVLIAAGRVSVDGAVVTALGTRVREGAVLTVDGERVVVRGDRTYLLLNKPRGVLSTMDDERGRHTVGDLVADRSARLFHVGRLDADTEGLLLLTDDGGLGQRVTHPRFGLAKTYLAEVRGTVAREALRDLRRGVDLDDGPARADVARLLQQGEGHALVEVVVHEGRNRLVRRMLDAVGHPVERLVRTGLGPLELGQLKPGRLRHLTQHELDALHRALDLAVPGSS